MPKPFTPPLMQDNRVKLAATLSEPRKIMRNGEEYLEFPFVAVTKNEEINDAGMFFEPAGLDVSRFLKNPTLVWSHNLDEIPIGRVTRLVINDAVIEGTAEMPQFKTPYFQDLRDQVERGQLKAISICFYIIEYDKVYSPPDGEGRQIVIGWRVTKSRLLEISLCTQGADENALASLPVPKKDQSAGAGEEFAHAGTWDIRQDATGVLCTLSLGGAGGAPPAAVDGPGAVLDALAVPDAASAVPDATGGDGGGAVASEEPEEGESQAAAGWVAIPYSRHGDMPMMAENADWSGPEMVAAASVDQLKTMCLFEDKGELDKKGGYKMPHHNTAGKVNWKGVASAMGVLMGARGGVKDVPDAEMKKGYGHLAKHYKQFDKKPPEFQQSLPAEELAALQEQGLILIPGAQQADGKGLPPSIEALAAQVIELKEMISAAFAAIKVLEDGRKAGDGDQAAPATPGAALATSADTAAKSPEEIIAAFFAEHPADVKALVEERVDALIKSIG